MTLVVLLVAIFIPWLFAFPDDNNAYLNMIILLFFILDIIFSFRTSFLNEQGDEIIKGRSCAWNYAKNPFFMIDLISTIPFDELADAGLI